MKIHLNGDFEDLKYFKLRKLKEEKNLLGYEIREIESKDEIGEAIQVGLFDTRPVLVIIHNASKLSKDDLERIFIASESFDLILVDKNTNKLKATHPLLKTETIEEPKKLEEWCIQFLQDHLKNDYGVIIEPNLAKAIISRVGTDLGHIVFECYKYSFLAENGKLEPKAVGSVLSQLGDVEGSKLIDAIKRLSAKDFLKIANEMENGKRDPAMGFIAGLYTYNVSLWLEVGLLLAKGVTAKDMANYIKMNPWFIENILVPEVKNIGLERIKNFVKIGSESEYGVLTGQKDVWNCFKSRIISLMIIK
jgi:DNA polymerase III delta subunit